MNEQLEFYNRHGYRRDMEAQLRSIGDGRPDSLATQAANQIKHLKESLSAIIEKHGSTECTVPSSYEPNAVSGTSYE